MTPRPASTRAFGFTLVELMAAFAILALVTAALVGIEAQSVRLAERALEYRDTSVMADTVFRRVVYEIDRYQDGDSGTADEWYCQYVGLKGTERNRWRDYRIVIHKRRGLVAGTDPSGRSTSLLQEGEAASGSTSTGTQGTGSEATGDKTISGEEAYLVTMDVYAGGDDSTPVTTLRSIVPVPPSEEEGGS